MTLAAYRLERGEDGFSLFRETPRLTRRPPPVLLPATRQVKLNTDESPSVATEYGIRSIPTLVFVRNGEVVDRLSGALPKAQLSERFAALVEGGIVQ